MTYFDARLAEVVGRDPRYAYEAYEFVFQALNHVQKMLGRQPAKGAVALPPGVEPCHHVSGPELLEGVRQYALQQFGLLARTVFRLWGVRRTDDFGEIVFNLVEAQLMSKTDEDTRADFHDVYDFERALVQNFQITLEEAS